jgi:hypothetical protein
MKHANICLEHVKLLCTCRFSASSGHWTFLLVLTFFTSLLAKEFAAQVEQYCCSYHATWQPTPVFPGLSTPAAQFVAVLKLKVKRHR